MSTFAAESTSKCNTGQNYNKSLKNSSFGVEKFMELARNMNDTTIFNLGGTVYAFDSTTIELCLAVFCWAKFRKKKGGIKSIPSTMSRLKYRLFPILRQRLFMTPKQ